MSDGIGTIFFQAEFAPHRSLSRRGLAWLIGSLATISLGVTTLFWLLGAWPIAGFNGVDIVLVALLLRANTRARRAREMIVLSDQGLLVRRLTPKGDRSELRLPPAWLAVSLEERPGRVPSLHVTARDRRVEIATCLGETEKREFAEALDAALQRWRHPIFDNPQLRDAACAVTPPRPPAPST